MENLTLDPRDYHLSLGLSTPKCLGCLDLNPLTFDWKAVHMATLYPDLDPLKIANGAYRGCSSCQVIMNGFRSFGHDLGALDNSYRVSLFNFCENDSLRAMISKNGKKVVYFEFYTVNGKPSSL
jgi:hypothetical protein